MNAFGVITYLGLAYIITVHVGLYFYRNGRVYILNLMEGDEEYTDRINKLLLVGYYLLNLGYCAVMIAMWNKAENAAELINNLITMLARIILTLGVLHYINMTTIYFLSKNNNHSLNKS